MASCAPASEGLVELSADTPTRGIVHDTIVEVADSQDATDPYFSSICTIAESLVFHNQDLLHIIFSGLLQPISMASASSAFQRNRPALYPTLLAVALTCKSFFNPAIRFIWEETTLTTLLCIIPVLIKREDTCPIKEEHLKRLDLYALQVRRLYIANEAFPTEIYTVISRLRKLVLPVLKMIKISSPDKSPLKNTAGLLLAMSPTLSDVQIGPLALDATSGVVLPVFFSGLPSETLGSLYLHGHLPNLVLDLLPRFTRLSFLRLEVEPTTGHEDIVGICSQIPMLKKLHLKFKTERRYPTSTATAFDTLETLSLSGAPLSVSDLLGIFQHVRKPSFLSLQVLIYPEARDPSNQGLQLSQCIDKCVQVAQSKSLQSVRFDAMALLPVPWDAFTALRRLSHLKALIVGAPKLSVTNVDVACFFEQGWWPELKKLAINFIDANSTLTAPVLGLLARSSPGLAYIETGIHIRNDEDLYSILQDEMHRNERPQSLVTRLRVTLVSSLQGPNIMHREHFSIKNAQALALYIIYCFPKLESVSIRSMHAGMSDVTTEAAEFEIDWAKGVQDAVQKAITIHGGD